MAFDKESRRKKERTQRTVRIKGMDQLKNVPSAHDQFGYDQIADIFEASQREKSWQENNRPIDSRKEKDAAYQEYMALRKAAKGRQQEEAPSRRKKKKKKRSLTRFLLVILFILLIFAVMMFLFAMNVLGKVGRVDIDQNNLGINPQVEENLKDYRNIALLGVDARDMNDFTKCRTDAIIIVSLDKNSKEIRQVSVFRDTYLYVNEKRGYDKVTNVHALEGTQGTLHTLNENMDLNIREVGIVNWKSVADAIDGMGGIEIDIQASEINEMNKYIRDTQRSVGGSKKKIKKAGLQILNGNQAVTYARIRKDSPKGDYRRNERMKLVLSGAMNKAKTLDPIKLNEIAKQVLPGIKTNMSTKDMFKLLWAFFTYDSGKQSGWPYKVAGWKNYGVWYGPPINLSNNVKKLYKKQFAMPNYTPTERVQQISQEICRRTGYY